MQLLARPLAICRLRTPLTAWWRGRDRQRARTADEVEATLSRKMTFSNVNLIFLKSPDVHTNTFHASNPTILQYHVKTKCVVVRDNVCFSLFYTLFEHRYAYLSTGMHCGNSIVTMSDWSRQTGRKVLRPIGSDKFLKSTKYKVDKSEGPTQGL